MSVYSLMILLKDPSAILVSLSATCPAKSTSDSTRMLWIYTSRMLRSTPKRSKKHQPPRTHRSIYSIFWTELNKPPRKTTINILVQNFQASPCDYDRYDLWWYDSSRIVLFLVLPWYFSPGLLRRHGGCSRPQHLRWNETQAERPSVKHAPGADAWSGNMGQVRFYVFPFMFHCMLGSEEL